MSSTEPASSDKHFDGSMFLYDKPTLLSKETHAGMGLSRIDNPYDFVRNVKGVPVVTNEIQSAQKHFPVVFTDIENPVLIAVLGIVDDINLFVDERGQWAHDSYVPCYIRCHPFAFARRGDDEFAVVIDEASQTLSGNPDIPFFRNGEITEAIQARIDFCGQVSREREVSKTFCDRVKELGLLAGQRVAQTMPDGAETKIAEYVTVDPQKLEELDKDTLYDLYKDGSLAAILAQIFSLENWNRLIARRDTARAKA